MTEYNNNITQAQMKRLILVQKHLAKIQASYLIEFIEEMNNIDMNAKDARTQISKSAKRVLTKTLKFYNNRISTTQ